MATCKIVTNDGIETCLNKRFAHRFITLRHLLELNAPDDPIPVSMVSSQVLNTLVSYLHHFSEENDPMLDFTGFCKKKNELTEQEQKTYERWVIHKKFLSTWETEFYNEMSNDALNELWNAADYLNCPFLLDSFAVEMGWRKVR